MTIEPSSHIRTYIGNRPKGYVNKKGDKLPKDKLHRYDMGENINGPPSSVKGIIMKLDLKKIISEYPDPVYNELVNRLTREYGVDSSNVTVGTGSNEILERISRTYLDVTDKCAIIYPTFYRIEDATLRCTRNIIEIKLNEENKFKLTEKDIDYILRMKDIKLIWVCSPNNPTGIIVPLNFIERLAKSKPNTLICVDEAWGEYVENWNEKYSCINLLNKYKNILVVRTFSKFYGLAGMTIGYALGSKELIEPLNHLRLEFPLNSLAEKLGVHILNNKLYFKEQIKLISDERKRLEKELDKLGNIVYIPSETSIMLIRHKNLSLHKELLKRNILTANMNDCKGVEGKKWVRITIQRERSKNDILLRILGKIKAN